MAAGTGNELWAALSVGVILAVLLTLTWLKGFIDGFRAGVAVSVTVSPAPEFMQIRSDVTSIDPTVEMEGATYEGGAITLHLLMASGRVEMLSNALLAMPQVTEVSRSRD